MLKQRFDYKTWVDHPEREDIKLVTTSGRQVHHFTDHFFRASADAPFPLSGVLDGRIYSWSITGCIDDYSEKVDFGSHENDLWMIVPEMYVNVFSYHRKNGIYTGRIHNSYEEAIKLRDEAESQNVPTLGTYKLVKV